jgi:2-keto-4-pentenoate hydratase
LNTEQQRLAAQTVWRHWRDGLAMAALPDSARPGSREQGYACQAHLPEVAQQPVLGWKIAATSQAGQQHINVSGPLAGRLLASRVHPPSARLSLAHNRMRVAEPEFAFRFGRALPVREQPYTEADVMSAVDAMLLAIEVPDSRFADFVSAGEPQLLADNACASQLWLGPEAVGDWRSVDLSRHQVTASVTPASGQPWQRVGTGEAVLGDPRTALVWLVHELCLPSRGVGAGLRLGDVVITGTCMKPLEVAPGDALAIDYGVFGVINAQFAP